MVDYVREHWNAILGIVNALTLCLLITVAIPGSFQLHREIQDIRGEITANQTEILDNQKKAMVDLKRSLDLQDEMLQNDRAILAEQKRILDRLKETQP